MGAVLNTITLYCVNLGILFSLAFTPQPQAYTSPIYFDDFERYNSDADIKKAYTVWDDGAVLNVSLNKTPLDPTVHSLRLNFGQPDQIANTIRIDVLATGQVNQSLKVELVSPNPVNNSVNGSIYHILSNSSRAWTGGSAVRFRIENPSSETLLLSFNFKEEYNEYWAVSSSGVFFLQGEADILQQRSIEYGNLPVPPEFQGYVLIPFYSFSVPDWNTARGDGVMNLKRIESFAFAVSLGHVLPREFFIDDVEVLPQHEFKTLTVQGAERIQVPASGEHREQYSAQLFSPAAQSSQQVPALWSLKLVHDARISMDADGMLNVPTGVPSGSIVISAAYQVGDFSVVDEFPVEIIGLTPAPTVVVEGANPMPQVPETAYERFSRGFELWAVEYRPIFVALSVGVILLILALLSRIQRRLK